MPPPPMICSSVETTNSLRPAAHATRSACMISRGSARPRTLVFSSAWMS
jgi:hypothetical protein